MQPIKPQSSFNLHSWWPMRNIKVKMYLLVIFSWENYFFSFFLVFIFCRILYSWNFSHCLKSRWQRGSSLWARFPVLTVSIAVMMFLAPWISLPCFLRLFSVLVESLYVCPRLCLCPGILPSGNCAVSSFISSFVVRFELFPVHSGHPGIQEPMLRG